MSIEAKPISEFFVCDKNTNCLGSAKDFINSQSNDYDCSVTPIKNGEVTSSIFVICNPRKNIITYGKPGEQRCGTINSRMTMLIQNQMKTLGKMLEYQKIVDSSKFEYIAAGSFLERSLAFSKNIGYALLLSAMAMAVKSLNEDYIKLFQIYIEQACTGVRVYPQVATVVTPATTVAVTKEPKKPACVCDQPENSPTTTTKIVSQPSSQEEQSSNRSNSTGASGNSENKSGEELLYYKAYKDFNKSGGSRSGDSDGGVHHMGGSTTPSGGSHSTGSRSGGSRSSGRSRRSGGRRR